MRQFILFVSMSVAITATLCSNSKESDTDTLSPLVKKILTLFDADSVAISNFMVHAQTELYQFCDALLISDKICFME